MHNIVFKIKRHSIIHIHALELCFSLTIDILVIEMSYTHRQNMDFGTQGYLQSIF